MKKENLVTKLLMAAVTIGVAAYFGVGIYRYFEDPFSTTLAYTYQISQGVDVTGYVVRQESVLPDEDAGVLRLARAEGEKVSRGGTVATAYADSDALRRQAQFKMRGPAGLLRMAARHSWDAGCGFEPRCPLHCKKQVTQKGGLLFAL